MKPFYLLSMLLCAFVACVQGAESNNTSEWPCFRGPNRSGISPDTGLLKKWPADGPKLLWTIHGLGRGYSTVSIKDGVLYTAGTAEHQSNVFAADLSGKIKWKVANGGEWKAPADKQWAKDFDGTRATPNIDDGIVYIMNELGHMTALNAVDGKEKWSIDLPKQFEAKVPMWGYAESVLIDGDRLYCYPGGKKGRMIALNKKTGEVIWANTDIADEAGYSSPRLVTDHGFRQILTMTATGVIGVAADSGKLLWRYEHVNRFQENCETPLYVDGKVLVSSGYRRGSDLLKLTYGKDAIAVERLWTLPKADNLSGGPILLDGHIYAAGYDFKGWYCLDLESGKLTCSDPKIGKAALTCADGLLYALLDNGFVTLSEPSKTEYKEISRFVCGGRLYLRHADNLYAYDISGR